MDSSVADSNNSSFEDDGRGEEAMESSVLYVEQVMWYWPTLGFASFHRKRVSGTPLLHTPGDSTHLSVPGPSDLK